MASLVDRWDWMGWDGMDGNLWSLVCKVQSNAINKISFSQSEFQRQVLGSYYLDVQLEELERRRRPRGNQFSDKECPHLLSALPQIPLLAFVISLCKCSLQKICSTGAKQQISTFGKCRRQVSPRLFSSQTSTTHFWEESKENPVT